MFRFTFRSSGSKLLEIFKDTFTLNWLKESNYLKQLPGTHYEPSLCSQDAREEKLVKWKERVSSFSFRNLATYCLFVFF